MIKKTFDINHTRLKRTTTITQTSIDQYNHMCVIVEFEHTLPDNYFKESDEITYGLYIDREFIQEFYDKMVKVQLENLNVNHEVEIFAHPHPGFEFIRARRRPGNKILIRFKARDPNKKDIVKHIIYWDNATGVFLSVPMGEVDAFAGSVSGMRLKSGELV